MEEGTPVAELSSLRLDQPQHAPTTARQQRRSPFAAVPPLPMPPLAHGAGDALGEDGGATSAEAAAEAGDEKENRPRAPAESPAPLQSKRKKRLGEAAALGEAPQQARLHPKRSGATAAPPSAAAAADTADAAPSAAAAAAYIPGLASAAAAAAAPAADGIDSSPVPAAAPGPAGLPLSEAAPPPHEEVALEGSLFEQQQPQPEANAAQYKFTSPSKRRRPSAGGYDELRLGNSQVEKRPCLGNS